MTPYENPHALMQRKRLWREEFCQRLLTMLIVGAGEHGFELRLSRYAKPVR